MRLLPLPPLPLLPPSLPLPPRSLAFPTLPHCGRYASLGGSPGQVKLDFAKPVAQRQSASSILTETVRFQFVELCGQTPTMQRNTPFGVELFHASAVRHPLTWSSADQRQL